MSQALSQLSQALLSAHQQRRLPAIPETQGVRREVMILRPLQPRDQRTKKRSVILEKKR